jgi:hypothetical protein
MNGGSIHAAKMGMVAAAWQKTNKAMSYEAGRMNIVSLSLIAT